MDNELFIQKKKDRKRFGFFAIFFGLIFLFMGDGANIQIANNAPFFILAIVINAFNMIRKNTLKVNYITLSVIILLVLNLYYFLIGYYEFGIAMGLFLNLLLILVTMNIEYSEKDIKLVVDGLILSSVIFSFLLLFFGKGYSRASLDKTTYTQTFGAEVEFEPNFLALILITGFEFSVYEAIKCIEEKNSKYTLRYIFCAGITFVAALITGSRSVLVTACILLVLLILMVKNTKIKGILLLVVGLLVLALMIALMTDVMSEGVFERMFENSYNDGSNQKRLTNWEHGLRVMKDRFLGFGPFNTAGVLYVLYGYPAAAHNTYVAFGVYYGIIGFLAFAVLTIGLVIQAWKLKQRVIFAMLISMIFEWNILECQHTLSMWIFLLICILTLNKAKEEQKTVEF